MVDTSFSQPLIFKLKLIKIKQNYEFHSSVALATFQTLSVLARLVATVPGSAGVEHFPRQGGTMDSAGLENSVTYELFSRHSKGLMKTIHFPTVNLPGVS